MMQLNTCMALILGGALFALSPARAATTHNLTGSAANTHASHESSDGNAGDGSSNADSTGSGHAHTRSVTQKNRADPCDDSRATGTTLPQSSSDCGNHDTGGSGVSHDSDSGLGWQSLLPGSIQ